MFIHCVINLYVLAGFDIFSSISNNLVRVFISSLFPTTTLPFGSSEKSSETLAYLSSTIRKFFFSKSLAYLRSSIAAHENLSFGCNFSIGRIILAIIGQICSS